MNIIEFRFCDEDRARLDALIAALERGILPWVSRHDDPGAPGPEGVPGEHPADASVVHLDPPAAPEPEVQPVALGELKKAVTLRCAESVAMRDKVKALVHQYAPSVSEIPEGKRAEVLAALADL